METKVRGFQRKGWNGNGARMLAIASWIAKIKTVKVKRKLVDKDIFLILVLILLAIKFIQSQILMLVILATSTSYIVKKLVSKIHLEDLLDNLDGDTQKLLVLKMMDYCELKIIDPESIEDHILGCQRRRQGIALQCSTQTTLPRQGLGETMATSGSRAN